MSKDELDALIIRNLGDLDLAVHRLESEIGDRVGKKIDAIAEAWHSEHGWEGKFSWNDEDDLWLAPPIGRRLTIRVPTHGWSTFSFTLGLAMHTVENTMMIFSGSQGSAK
jgi:hypothetical protein